MFLHALLSCPQHIVINKWLHVFTLMSKTVLHENDILVLIKRVQPANQSSVYFICYLQQINSLTTFYLQNQVSRS